MNSRRDALATIRLNVSEEPNAGLWLDKFITSLSKEDKESHSALAKQVIQIEQPESYETIYKRWKESLERLGAICQEAHVHNRLAVGLGSEGVLETSVTLHRTYGLPYIPGSALKGLAAAFARHYCGDDWQPDTDNYKIVFGTTDTAGYMTFFDALYIPGSGHDGQALHFDVMTVHHRAYYEEKTDNSGQLMPPADWDDPNPVPFISATGDYLIALAAPKGCESWCKIALEIVKAALKHEGVGGKTSSGYGRMELKTPPPDPDEQKANGMIRRIDAIPPVSLVGELGQRAGELLKSEIREEQKQRIAVRLIERTQDAGKKQARNLSEKEWYKALLDLLQANQK